MEQVVAIPTKARLSGQRQWLLECMILLYDSHVRIW